MFSHTPSQLGQWGSGNVGVSARSEGRISRRLAGGQELLRPYLRISYQMQRTEGIRQPASALRAFTSGGPRAHPACLPAQFSGP